MNAIRISATAARNNFFEILNQVAAGREYIIEKDNKEVATISHKKTKTDWVALENAFKASHGIFKHLSVEEISPLRRKGAWGNFGEWDRDLKVDKNGLLAKKKSKQK